jgi:hypothetical protein
MKALEEKYSVDQFIKQFGIFPADKELKMITESFLRIHHKQLISCNELIDAFGKDWVEIVLKYNERIEEYEICSIFRDLLKEYKN